MPELVAQGNESNFHWRRPLTEGKHVVIGRAAGLWTVPWDPYVSRRHVELLWRQNKLEGQLLATAQNPIFVRGRYCRQFQIRVGEHFVVGNTTFSVVEPAAEASQERPPAMEQTFSAEEIDQTRYRDADHRIDCLQRLPEVIANASTEKELFAGLSNVLLAGISRATVAGIVSLQDDSQELEILHLEERRMSSKIFRVSTRLVSEALSTLQQSVVHIWREGEGANQFSTIRASGQDWAFCTPVKVSTDRIWGVYVSGKFTGRRQDLTVSQEALDLKDDIKFAEMLASLLGSLYKARQLERQNASLTQYISPTVLEQFKGDNPEEALRPRECDVAVLFCDLRGFSRDSEAHSGNLLGVLERVGRALGVMTSQILKEEGVVGDFQGDAALGFWGWPVDQNDRIARACCAAVGIRTRFESAAKIAGDPLAGFRVGIGIAAGPAVAGKIGTTDQAKLGVFGPTVNLASRLEGMSKLLRAPILLDEVSAKVARQMIPRSIARVRRVAVVNPVGLEQRVEVSELLPPENAEQTISDSQIEAYEKGLDAFCAGDWNLALEYLHKVPHWDEVKDFLTGTITQHKRVPPPDWSGVITLTSKG